MPTWHELEQKYRTPTNNIFMFTFVTIVLLLTCLIYFKTRNIPSFNSFHDLLSLSVGFIFFTLQILFIRIYPDQRFIVICFMSMILSKLLENVVLVYTNQKQTNSFDLLGYMIPLLLVLVLDH